MKKLPFEIHPAAEIFPLMRPAAFAELVEDIREHGVNESIVFWKGKLLDGRNRSLALMELGLDPMNHACDIETEDLDPVAYVLSTNLHRRHLGETEREAIAAKVANLKNGEAGNGRGVGGANAPPTKSNEEAASQLNVSVDNVKRAKAAIKGGCKELVALLEAGDIPSSTASKFVKAIPDKKEQAKILKGGLAAVRQAIKESKQSQPRPSIKAAAEDAVEHPQAEAEKPKAKPKSSERQFFNDLRKLFDEMDDFHKQRSLELWSEWLLTKETP